MAVILVVRFMMDFIVRGNDEEEEEEVPWFLWTPLPRDIPMLLEGLSR